MLILGTLLLLAATGGSPSGDSSRASNPNTSAQKAPVKSDAGDGSMSPELGHGFECSAVEVSSIREASRRRTFSASRSLDLELRTRLAGKRRSPATVEFRVFTPRGYLYQSLAVPVAAEAANQRRLDREVTSTLLVAGTAITTNSLYGRWAVETRIDGQPCGKGTEFTLTP